MNLFQFQVLFCQKSVNETFSTKVNFTGLPFFSMDESDAETRHESIKCILAFKNLRFYIENN